MRSKSIVCFLILIICNAMSCRNKDETSIISISIYNLSSSSAINLSNIIVVNGFDNTDISLYPITISSGGGEFTTSMESGFNSFILSDLILIIQNFGQFRIEITNSIDVKALEFGKNRIEDEGSLAFIHQNIQWYIKTIIINDTYNVFIIVDF